MKLLLATHNGHKRREFERLFELAVPDSVELDVLPDTVTMPPEDGETFAENALGKARAAAAATSRVSIADDSGIAAAALGGAPGVRSARYAGEHATDAENLEKLLREVPAGSALEYVCAIAYVDPGTGVERVFEGRCSGRLAAGRGASAGSATTRRSYPMRLRPRMRGSLRLRMTACRRTCARPAIRAWRSRRWPSSQTSRRTRLAIAAGLRRLYSIGFLAAPYSDGYTDDGTRVIQRAANAI